MEDKIYTSPEEYPEPSGSPGYDEVVSIRIDNTDYPVYQVHLMMDAEIQQATIDFKYDNNDTRKDRAIRKIKKKYRKLGLELD